MTKGVTRTRLPCGRLRIPSFFAIIHPVTVNYLLPCLLRNQPADDSGSRHSTRALTRIE